MVQLARGKGIFWFGWHAATDRHRLSMQWASPFSHPLLSCSASLSQMETYCVHDLPWGCSLGSKSCATIQGRGLRGLEINSKKEGKIFTLSLLCASRTTFFFLPTLFKTRIKAVFSPFLIQKAALRILLPPILLKFISYSYSNLKKNRQAERCRLMWMKVSHHQETRYILPLQSIYQQSRDIWKLSFSFWKGFTSIFVSITSNFSFHYFFFFFSTKRKKKKTKNPSTFKIQKRFHGLKEWPRRTSEVLLDTWHTQRHRVGDGKINLWHWRSQRNGPTCATADTIFLFTASLKDVGEE